MRFSFLLCFLLVLMSCSAPGSRFRGVEPVQVFVDGAHFDVYHSGEDVTAIRMNFAVLPNLLETTARALVEIELATVCKVVLSSVSGDQALIKARVVC